jgi:uncharacterized protein (TIGR01568 family)
MVQMVVEMGLCDWDGLRGILGRLLVLNAPCHHAAILTAFAEICMQLAGAGAALALNAPRHHASILTAFSEVCGTDLLFQSGGAALPCLQQLHRPRGEEGNRSLPAPSLHLYGVCAKTWLICLEPLDVLQTVDHGAPGTPSGSIRRCCRTDCSLSLCCR